MKKFILLSLMAVFALSACRKEKKTQIKSTSAQIASILWHTTLEQYEYFDANNKSMLNKKNTPGAHYKFEKNKLTLTGLKGNITYGTYSISNKNGNDYITVTLNGITEEYVIATVTNQIMIWTQEKTNQTFQKTDAQTVAAKQATTIKFHCPCPE